MEDYIGIVQQFGRTYRSFMSAFEAQVGHAMPRWRILLALTDPDGEWSQKRLVERLRIDPGALTRQLKSLEALGWIERSVDARDNRVTNVRLTNEGRHAVDASLPQRNAFLLETMGALPDDALSALSNALAKLEARIGEVAGSPPPAGDTANSGGAGGQLAPGERRR
jgi:DNA-binding MarR family transcriptional regulator